MNGENIVRKNFAAKTKKKPASKQDYGLGVAMQGGGSYGAFTKGALIALLEDGIISAETLKAVSGTSAGAKNGALLVDGLTSGTPESAIEKLDNYWHDVGKAFESSLSSPIPFMNFFIPTAITQDTYPNLTEDFQRAAKNVTMPRGFMFRQLQKMLDKHITSWKALRTGPIAFFANAVKEDTKTGKREHRVFTGKELSATTVPLSANLHEFGPAEYRNKNYYDGAYWRNPCFDGIIESGVSDLLVINIQPKPAGPVKPVHKDDAREALEHPGHEILGEEIHNHMAWLAENHPEINLHEIKLDVDPRWDDSSRMNAHPLWLEQLSEMGYNAAKHWIAANKHLLGKASSYKTDNHASNDNKTAPRKREPATG